MGRREYGQECSLACALDRVGERWSLLIVRELSLGPLRFSELARSVGGAPTDVLTKRLRDLEGDGIVSRRELAAPVAATVYELTELGRGLERPMIELARWGMELQKVEDVVGLAPSSLPNALRVILRPPREGRFRPGPAQQRPELRPACPQRLDRRLPRQYRRPRPDALGIADRGCSRDRRRLPAIAVEVEGDAALLDELRAMVVIPDHLRKEAAARFAQPVGAGVLS